MYGTNVIHSTASHAVTLTDALQVAETDSDDDIVDDEQEKASMSSPPTDAMPPTPANCED